MPSPVVTPNMSLTEPGVGVTLSPSWALLLNDNFGVIDQHNHTTGMGVPIPPTGLDISSDLTFQGNSLLDVNTLVFQGVVGTPAVLSSYSNGTDLFFKDIDGNAIQLTRAGGPNAGSGNISGLPSTPIGGAGIAWANATSTFQMLLDAGTVGANVEMGTAVLRYPGAYPTPSGTNFVALQVPAAISAGYGLTLPLALPVSQKFMTLDASGNIAAPWSVDNSTLEISGGTTLQVKSGGIGNTQLATGAALANIGTGGVTDAYLGSNLNLTGKVKANSYPVIGYQFTSEDNINVIGGYVTSAGSVSRGSGFSASRTALGQYTITLTDAFATPMYSAVFTTVGSTNLYGVQVTSLTSGAISINIKDLSGNFVDTDFTFMAMGLP